MNLKDGQGRQSETMSYQKYHSLKTKALSLKVIAASQVLPFVGLFISLNAALGVSPAFAQNNQAQSVPSPTSAGFQNPLDDIRPESGKINGPDNQLPSNFSTTDTKYGVPGQVTEPGFSRFEDTIEVRVPQTSELMPFAEKLPPIRLEASYTAPVSLKDCLTFALTHNLDLGIQRETVVSQKWLYRSSLGRFLPDAILSYDSQLQHGSLLVGGVIPATIHTPLVNTYAQYRLWGFRGGSVLFGSLVALHNYKAAKAGLRGSLNDVMLAVTQRYYDLVRNQALLDVQVRAVETSKAQLTLNQQLEKAGTGTRFSVLQSETQLASDEQNLLAQEIALRNSAIQLAVALNLDLGVNLMPLDLVVKKVRLIDPQLDVKDLLAIAIDNRPELKQYEELRLAAKRQIQVAAAPLYPTFQFYGLVRGSGATLSRTIAVTPGEYTPVALNTPVPNAVAATNGTSITSPVTSVGATWTPAQQVNRQIRESYQIGFTIGLNYDGMGVPAMANVQSAKAVARQALLNANKVLLTTVQQVRVSYLNSQNAERRIDVAGKAVISSSEQLRLARVRLANGVGTNLDVIAAQQAYTQALSQKADAIIQFNNAQAQLLHDLGLANVETLCSGRLLNKQNLK